MSNFDPETLKAFLPPQFQALSQEMQSMIQHSVQAWLSQTPLVTREEFDIQAQVLAKTRQKLEQLTQRLEALENQVSK